MTKRLKVWKRLARNGQKGMTLIEIMIVIAIIGIVMSAVGYGVMSYRAQAQVDAARMDMEKIASILEMHYARYDEFPSSLDDLTKTEKGQNRQILKKSQLKDPWRKKYIYSSDSTSFKLCSGGPDKKEGTDDDICHGDEDPIRGGD